MADLTITDAQIQSQPLSAGASFEYSKTLGEDVDAAMRVLRLDGTLDKWYLADADDESILTETIGLSTSAGKLGQQIVVQKAGKIRFNGVGTAPGPFTAGVVRYISTTPGALCLESDLATDDYVVRVGSPDDTELFTLDIKALVVKG